MTEWRHPPARMVPQLWPLGRSAHIAYTREAFEIWLAAEPWRARLSDTGDALLLAVWRQHLGYLAMRGVWAAPERIPAVVDEAVRVAAERGFGAVVSPLLPRTAWPEYEAAGMSVREAIVALQADPADLTGRPAGFGVEAATPQDLDALLAVDDSAFDRFWAYGAAEMAHALEVERVTLVRDGGLVVGYASSAIIGPACTIGRLAVSPSARRRGVASALVRETAGWARRTGAAALSLCTQQSNTASRALYAGLHFVEVNESYAILERAVRNEG